MRHEFVGGNVALDFVATVSERNTRHLERLTQTTELSRWIAEAGLLDRTPHVTEDELTEARALREALYELVVALTSGAPPPRRALTLVNAAAAEAPPTVRADRSGTLHRDGDVRAALAAIARAGLSLFEVPRDRIRWCSDAECTRAFVDHSRGRARRWCGMSGCGDRAKAAAYRRRQRATKA